MISIGERCQATNLTNPVWDSSAGLAGNIHTLLGWHHLALLPGVMMIVIMMIVIVIMNTSVQAYTESWGLRHTWAP